MRVRARIGLMVKVGEIFYCCGINGGMIIESGLGMNFHPDFCRAIAAIGRGDYPQVERVPEHVGRWLQDVCFGKNPDRSVYGLWFPAVEMRADEVSNLTVNSYDKVENTVNAPFRLEEQESFYLSEPGSVWGRVFDEKGYTDKIYIETRKRLRHCGWWEYLKKFRPEYLEVGKLQPQIFTEGGLIVGSIFALRTEYDYHSQSDPIGMWGVFDRKSYGKLCRQINQIGRSLNQLDHDEED